MGHNKFPGSSETSWFFCGLKMCEGITGHELDYKELEKMGFVIKGSSGTASWTFRGRGVNQVVQEPVAQNLLEENPPLDKE